MRTNVEPENPLNAMKNAAKTTNPPNFEQKTGSAMRSSRADKEANGREEKKSIILSGEQNIDNNTDNANIEQKFQFQSRNFHNIER